MGRPKCDIPVDYEDIEELEEDLEDLEKRLLRRIEALEDCVRKLFKAKKKGKKKK